MLFKNGGVLSVFNNKKIDANTLEELENILITSDISANIVTNIVNSIRNKKPTKETTIDDIKGVVFEKLLSIVKYGEKVFEFSQKPCVMLFMGVNGSGKTTTIGKIANKLVKKQKKVLLVAGDTFRAGATEQLQLWAKKTKSDIITKQRETEEPATLVCRAYTQAKEKNYDFMLIDTSGRLQNNINLMEELKKIGKVLKKMDKDAPHQSILILDANIGQNSLKQFKSFNETVEVNSMIINKLDSTAKAGTVISILNQFKKPIFAIGVGEKVDDIEDFNSKKFLENLLGIKHEG